MDRFVDTSPGKDTLHDTDGINYRFDEDESRDFGNNESMDSSISQVDEDSNDLRLPSPKKRRFHEVSRDIQLYCKKPVANMSMLSANPIVEAVEACKYTKEVAKDKDFLWLMSFSQIYSIPI